MLNAADAGVCWWFMRITGNIPSCQYSPMKREPPYSVLPPVPLPPPPAQEPSGTGLVDLALESERISEGAEVVDWWTRSRSDPGKPPMACEIEW